ncbi:MAG TPA: hypothetical protein VN514_08485 [Ignavibacteria bacterium]|nr:hypothetical protein [Ignavibacteria bacterium]
MAKSIKKSPKKPLKKAAKKTVKKIAVKKAVKKIAVKKPGVKKTVKKAAMPVLLPNRKMFAMEITLLDKLQTELFDSIAAKPEAMDFDEIRLFVDNVFMTLNKSVTIAKDVKNMLLNKDFKEPITETYNSPA